MESQAHTSDFVARPGQPRVGRRIPVVSWANAGKGNNYSDLAEFIQEHVDTDCKDEHALAVIIEGDSMEPRFEAGDIVVLAPSSEPRTGDFVVARLCETGQVFFKKFFRTGPEGQTIRLLSLNPQYAPIEHPVSAFRFIYPVVELHAKLR